MSDEATPPPPSGWPAFRAKLAAAARTAKERAGVGARVTGERLRTAPWLKIGMWAGGVVGVLIAAVVLFLAFADWNALRGPISRYASSALDRKVSIEGNLKVKAFSFRPRAEVHRLRIANPDWAGPGDTVSVDTAVIEIKLLPLLWGSLDMTLLELNKPIVDFLRQKSGRATWIFGKGDKKEPLKLPPIRRFVLNDGQLSIHDEKRKITFVGAFASDETPMGEGDKRVFRIEGDGKLNGEPFTLDAVGAPLLNVRRDRPYGFRADMQAGSTHILAAGRLDTPFDLGRYSAKLDLKGPDLSYLYLLFGLALPNTPPYTLSADLRRERKFYTLSNIEGVVGDTDLHGSLKVDTSGERPKLIADLNSRSLDFDDLNVVLGGPPDTGKGESASPKQAALAQEMAAEQRLLPDARLDMDRVRSMDAELKYRAGDVKTKYLPLRQFALDLKLEDGLMTMDKIAFALPKGQITGAARIDAREATPDVDIDMKLTGARVEDFVARSSQPQAVSGVLQARAKLRGKGRSVHEAAANANGAVTVVVPNGEIREAFAELLGINVTKGLGLLLTKSPKTTPVRCAVADFQAKNGVLYAQTIVMDTGVVLATGKGTINLKDESLDLTLKGQPKEVRLVRLSAPVDVTGKLRAPKVGVDAGDVAQQAGIAAALGTLLAPLAAILPFVDAGLADDANCKALIKEARGA